MKQAEQNNVRAMLIRRGILTDEGKQNPMVKREPNKGLSRVNAVLTRRMLPEHRHNHTVKITHV